MTERLIDLGYARGKKQGLFYKHCIVGTVFLQYYKKNIPIISFKHGEPKWMSNRMLQHQIDLLLDNNIHFDDPRGIWYDIDDTGICIYCQKEFDDFGTFCSSSCKMFSDAEIFDHVCGACYTPITDGFIVHHTQYYPDEKTMDVHLHCHQAIHKTADYPHLCPHRADSKKFYARKPRPMKQYVHKKPSKQVLMIQKRSIEPMAEGQQILSM